MFALFLAMAASGLARPEFLPTARLALDLRKGGAVERASCSLCHSAGGPPDLNPFGSSLYQAMRSGKIEVVTPAALMSILNKDSDGDGYTNLEEARADTLPGDAASHPNAHSSARPLSKMADSKEAENPLSLASIFLARHAQHPVFVHVPIALFIVSVCLDLVAWWKRDERLASVGNLNLQIAGGTSLLAVASGILAWRLKFGGASLSGFLLLHLIGGITFATATWAMIAVRNRQGQPAGRPVALWYFAIAAAGLAAVVGTGHLGGVLSGVAE